MRNRRLRIALDSRKLVGPLSGIGQYIQPLVSHMAMIAADFEFILLTESRLDPALVPTGSRQVALRLPEALRGLSAKITSPYWMNVAVPEFLIREGVALFHGTNFVAPVVGKAASVVTVHDLAFIAVPSAYTPAYSYYMRMFAKASARRARLVIVDSVATATDARRLFGLRADRVEVIYPGVPLFQSLRGGDAEAIPFGVRRGLPTRYIFHAGVVQPRKNLGLLIAAAEPLVEEGLLDGLVLAGADGPMSRGVHETARRSRIADRVHFLGHVAAEDMPSLYEGAACVAVPSLYEGFGFPVVEAMAYGVPVVVSSSSSLPEVAGGAAVCVAPSDVSAWTAALREVITNSGLRQRLRSLGMERARCFSWERAALLTIDVYRRAIGM